MATCANCGKGPTFCNRVSFSNHKTRRRFNPNIQTVTVMKDGRAEKALLHPLHPNGIRTR